MQGSTVFGCPGPPTLVPEVQGFRNLARTEFSENLQEGFSQVRLLFNFVLLVFPARRERFGENSSEALLVPVAVLERSHNLRQLLDSH